MTTKLERKFFETFGIEQREFKGCNIDTYCPYDDQECGNSCPYYKTYKVDYPTITDTHYLEMLCILGECDEFPCFETVKELKTETLKLLIANYEDFVQMDYKGSDEWAEELKTKIQALFKGE